MSRWMNTDNGQPYKLDTALLLFVSKLHNIFVLHVDLDNYWQ